MQIKKQCCGSTLASIRIMIHIFFLLNTHLDPGSQTNGEPDTDPDQTLTSPKGDFTRKVYFM